jgi:Phospholipase_D-nuclease N-terminal
MEHSLEHSFGAGIGILFFLFFLAIGILVFVFWLRMLIDAIRNPRLSDSERIVWVLVIIFLQILGALIYFFVGRRT